MQAALVLDCRQHRGGDSDIEAYFLGYFFEQSRLVSTFYRRDEEHGRQHWTAAVVAGPRFLERPVVMLVSEVTGSAGESFAYFMQHSGRASVIGRPTAGAAHPGNFVDVHPRLKVFVPDGRPVSALTGQDWEGIGVQPDVPTDPDGALQTALQWLTREVDK